MDLVKMHGVVTSESSSFYHMQASKKKKKVGFFCLFVFKISCKASIDMQCALLKDKYIE